MTIADCHAASRWKRSWPWLLLAFAVAFVAWKAYSQDLLVAPETLEAVEQQAVCFALLATALAFGLLQWTADSDSRFRLWHVIQLLAVVAVMAAWILNRGMIQFGSYDQSIIINSGWLQLLGRKPGLDYPYTLPPLFFLGCKYAMQWFGVNWRANVILTAGYAAVNCAWCYALLRALDLPHRISLFMAFAGQALTLMLTSFWWHNTLTGLAAITFTLSALGWLHRPESKLLPASLSVAMVLVLLSKPNAWLLPVAIVIMFLASGRHRFGACWCVLVAITVSALVVQWMVIDVRSLLHTYRQLARTRATDPEQIHVLLHMGKEPGEIDLEALKLYAVAAVFIALWLAPRRLPTMSGQLISSANLAPRATQASDAGPPRQVREGYRAKTEPQASNAGPLLPLGGRGQGEREEAANERNPSAGRWHQLLGKENLCYAAAFATGVAFFVGNKEMKVMDLALPVLLAAVWAAVYRRAFISATGMARVAGHAIVFLALWFLCYSTFEALCAGWIRERLQFVGKHYYDPVLCQEHPGTSLFTGVRSGCGLVRTIDQLNRFLAEHPRDEVFFGMHLEFAYAAFDRSPPRGLPIWWHFGTSYLSEDLPRLASIFRSRRIPWLIFPTGASEEMHYHLPVLSNYAKCQQTSELLILCPRSK
jgi:hypothetical protein